MGSRPTFGYSYHTSSSEQLFFLSFAAWYARCVALLSFGDQDDDLVSFACYSGIAYGADLHWSLLEQLSFGCFVLDGHRVLRGILVGIRVVFGLGTPYGWVFAHATIFVYTIFWHLDLSPAFVGDPMRPGLQWFNACDFNLHPHLPAWYTGKMTGVVALS